MATKAMIAKCCDIIVTLYPNFAQNTSAEKMINAWGAVLRDYSDEEVSVGLEAALKESHFAPVPADVIAQINKARAATLPSAAELWDTYRNILADVHRHEMWLGCRQPVGKDGKTLDEVSREGLDSDFENAPAEIKAYVGTKANLIEKSHLLCDENDWKYEQQRFTKSIPTIRAELEGKLMMQKIGNLLKSGEERRKING